MEEKIYIEKEGEFYDVSGVNFSMLLPPFSTDLRQFKKTDKRDFEIGARVYFEGVGWTEVTAQTGCTSDIVCRLTGRCEGIVCGDTTRKDNTNVVFKRREIAEEKKESQKEEKELTLSTTGRAAFSRPLDDYMEKVIADRVIDAVETITDGLKHDKGKIRMDLLPVESLLAVAEVMTFGA